MNDPQAGGEAALPFAGTPRQVLSYSTARPGVTVTIAHFGSELEAALPYAELNSEGISCQMLNANVNGLGFHFRGLSDVELQVHEQDAERARQVLDRVYATDLEPADPSPDLPGESGNDGRVVAAGAYESVREMREAQTVLASHADPVLAAGPRSPGRRAAGKRQTLYPSGQ